MDARKDRIGEHATEHQLPWAVAALGPVPEHPVDRLDWQKRASSIGAWRELSGYHHPAEPIGPEPATAAPDVRAAWYEALAALGPADGPDVRGMPDEAADSRGQHDTAARQQDLAGSYRALHEVYRQREAVFAATMADRADWDAATSAQRHLAVAADAELRRRHPGQRFTPLRSAEPQPAAEAERDELALTPGQPIPETGQWIKDLAAEHHVFADKLAERQSLTVPSEDPGYGDLGRAFPPWAGPGRDAILQPPKPEIRPSAQVLERAADRDVDWEAAD